MKFKVDDHIIIHHKNYDSRVVPQHEIKHDTIFEIASGTNGSKSCLENLQEGRMNSNQVHSDNSIENKISESESSTNSSKLSFDNLFKNGNVTFMKIPSENNVCMKESSKTLSDGRHSRRSDYSSDSKIFNKYLSPPEKEHNENEGINNFVEEVDDSISSLNNLLKNGSVTYTKLGSQTVTSNNDITESVIKTTSKASDDNNTPDLQSYNLNEKDERIETSVKLCNSDSKSIDEEYLTKDEENLTEERQLLLDQEEHIIHEAEAKIVSTLQKDKDVIEKNAYFLTLGTSISISAMSEEKKENQNVIDVNNSTKAKSSDVKEGGTVEIPSDGNYEVQPKEQSDYNIDFFDDEIQSSFTQKKVDVTENVSNCVPRYCSRDSNEALSQLLNSGSFSFTKIVSQEATEKESLEKDKTQTESDSGDSLEKEIKTAEVNIESDTFCSSDEDEYLPKSNSSQASEEWSKNSTELNISHDDNKSIVRFVCPYCDILSFDKSFLDEHIFEVHEVAGRPVKQMMFLKIGRVNYKKFRSAKRRNSEDSIEKSKRMRKESIQDLSEDSTTLTENLFFDTFDSEDDLHIEGDNELGDECASSIHEKSSEVFEVKSCENT